MKEYLLIQVAAAAAIGIAAWRTLPETMMCAACGQLQRRGVFKMMDVLMVGTLAVSFGLVWLLIRWCQKQLDDPES